MSRDEQTDEIQRALDAALRKHVPRHQPSAGFAARLRARLDAASEPASASPAPRPPFPRGIAFVSFAGAIASAVIVALAMRPGAIPAPAETGASSTRP